MQKLKFYPNKVYGKGQMALFYGVSPKTFSKWVKPIAKKHPEAFPGSSSDRSHLYTPLQIDIIIKELGPI